MLHVVQSIEALTPEKGGPSRTVGQLSAALSSLSDTRVSVVCAYPATITDHIEFHTSFRTLRAHNSSLVIHDNGLWRFSNFQAARAAATLKVPLVISAHGMAEPWALRHHRFRKRVAMSLYQGWTLRRASAFHATCPEEATNLRRIGITQPIAIVANGIETVPPATQVVTSTSRTALFLSRLHPKKGVLELLEAWSRVRPENWLLRIVGPDDGNHRSMVEQRIAQLQLSDVVRLCGEANDVEKWQHYRDAQLFVLPTFSENFGLVIGEALAAGVPVITTTETPWHAIASKGCGWIIRPDITELAGVLATATHLSPSALTAMGKVGQHWIPQDFSWQRLSEQMREFYAWLANGKPSSDRPGFIV